MRLFTRVNSMMRRTVFGYVDAKTWVDDWMNRIPDVGPDPVDRTISLIARTPDSPAAKAVLQNADDLLARGLRVVGVYGEAPKDTRIVGAARLADIPNAGRIQEQIVFGRQGLWSGASFEDRFLAGLQRGAFVTAQEAPDAPALARLRFASTWSSGRRV